MSSFIMKKYCQWLCAHLHFGWEQHCCLKTNSLAKAFAAVWFGFVERAVLLHATRFLKRKNVLLLLHTKCNSRPRVKVEISTSMTCPPDGYAPSHGKDSQPRGPNQTEYRVRSWLKNHLDAGAAAATVLICWLLLLH